MKSITDMFIEVSTRFFTNLNWVDLGERAANSMVRQVDFGMALQLIEGMLIWDLSANHSC